MDGMMMPGNGKDALGQGTAGAGPGKPADPVKLAAKEKLEKELQEEENKAFAGYVIGYLIKRCEEDGGMAQDVARKQKSWKECFSYIMSQAGKVAQGRRAFHVDDEVVCEWAEDYYREDGKSGKDGKAEKPKRKEAPPAAHVKPVEAVGAVAPPKGGGGKGKQPTSQGAGTHDGKGEAEGDPPKREKQKKNGKEMDGQMDLFSMLGM